MPTSKQASSDGRRAWLLRCRAHSLAASLPLTHPPSLPHHHHHRRAARVRSLFSCNTSLPPCLFNHLLSLSLSLSISLILEVGQNCLIESCDSHTHTKQSTNTHRARDRDWHDWSSRSSRHRCLIDWFTNNINIINNNGIVQPRST